MNSTLKTTGIKLVLCFLLLFAAENVLKASAIEDTVTDYRAQMRTFVREISAYSKSKKPDFIIIPQNGLEVALSKDGKSVEEEYVDSIDGAGQESIFFGYPKDNARTPKAMSEYLCYVCDILKEHGKPILSIDYCSGKRLTDISYAQNMQKGYVSFAADKRLLTNIPQYPKTPHNSNIENIKNLSDAKNFLYLINGNGFSSKDEFINSLKNTNYDLIITDRFQNDSPFTASETAKLKIKNSGASRLLICYMSIGEAEDYRYYWKKEWKQRKPSWLEKENPEWKGNYKVKYWDTEWKSIIFGSDDAYLDRILAAGFDGVYLDIIDAFEYFESKQKM
ncbi:MAG: endo alpha-1,4 polygalactosaminidase [Treponema sp.]